MSEALEFVLADPSSPWWGEHRSRYHFAGKIVSGRTVIDIACGSGLGASVLLLHGAERVVGIDTSDEALAHGRSLLDEDCALVQADGHMMPVRDSCVGAVTSFETLEHVTDPDRFMSEIRRVLGPGGVLVLSTPNVLHTRLRKDFGRNPFHLREYEPEELYDLLSEYFTDVQMYGQVVHPRYRPCPFWESAGRLPRDLPGRVKVWIWKLQNRLPYGVKNRLARWIYGRPFFPDEHGFVFHPDKIERGHVLVAVCR